MSESRLGNLQAIELYFHCPGDWVLWTNIDLIRNSKLLQKCQSDVLVPG